MASLVLPDSSFYIAAMRAGRNPLQELGARSDAYELAVCGVVQIEILRGRRDPRVWQRFRDAFAAMLFIHATHAVWQRAADLAWRLDRQGVVIPATDLIIAACALETKAAVLTHDAHFRCIPGLEVWDGLG